MFKSNKFVLFLLVASSFSACQSNKIDNWEMNLPVIGSNSSPKTADLNQDGILDIVIGAGRNEFQAAKYGVIAINGANGDTLWTYPCTDQIYTSAVFLDITKDDTPDVFMAGRNHQLYALNGKTGKNIWTYGIQAHTYTPKGLARFNFYNPILIEDYSEDGLADLLIVNGGNVRAAAGDTTNRHPGVLMILDSANGNTIALDTMPDGRESYLTPTYIDFDQDGTKEIIFGTGGETVTGGLYVTDEKALLQNDISRAKQLIEIPNGHGFIAPPIVADFTADGTMDILALDHGGVVFLFDGTNFTEVWKLEIPNVELNAQASIGNYNRDAIPDIFINGARGKWPSNTGSYQFFVDGKTGKIIQDFEIGCAGFASPVTLALDQEGIESALLPINKYDCRRNNTMYATTWLQYFSIDTTYQLTQTLIAGKNISSTPLLTDLDHDNQLDILYIVNENVRLIYEFLGLRVKRLELPIAAPHHACWAQYLGVHTNNIKHQ